MGGSASQYVPCADRARGFQTSGTSPPTLQAGKLDDLVMAHESWRDIRPHHLKGCGPLCEEDFPSPASSRSSTPMAPYGSFLRSLDDSSDLPSKSPSTRTAQLSPDYKESKIPESEFGFRPYANLKGRPFKVYAGFHMTRQARLWRSPTVDRVAESGAMRAVCIPSETGLTFDTIFQMMIKDIGAKVYIYGGVLRDVIMKGEHVADDIDVLFTCTVQALVDACEKRGWKEGDEKNGVKGDFYLKRDEKTGERRFDYISIGEGKEKFSGHTLDSNCAGEFAFNCMLYDVELKILIDASGWGIQDAAFNFLRIPYDGGHISPDGKSQWELWSESCDRMPGMISLRFFNFRSRGYGASPQTIEHNVRWILHQSAADVRTTVMTFLKRKVIVASKGVDTANKKLKCFKDAVVENFDSALGGGEGEKWWAQCIEPCAQELLAKMAKA